jgi:hypothetical protein
VSASVEKQKLGLHELFFGLFNASRKTFFKPILPSLVTVLPSLF